MCPCVATELWLRALTATREPGCQDREQIYNMESAQCSRLPWAVREITKSSSTFSATNVSSNIVWFLQLHDTIQMKSNYAWINYNHDTVAIRSHIVIYIFVWNFIFGTNFSSIYLAKGEYVWCFRLSFFTFSVRKMVLICLMQNMCLLFLVFSSAWNEESASVIKQNHRNCLSLHGTVCCV